MDQYHFLNSSQINRYLLKKLSFLGLHLNYLQSAKKSLEVIQMEISMSSQFFNTLKSYLNTKAIYEIDNFYTSYTKRYHLNYLK